jgi:hypothetical protein
MNHEIPSADWMAALSEAIKSAGDGDVILCRSRGMIEAALNLKQKLAPEKSLRFDLKR